MDQLEYRENVLTTGNTELAATFVLFGGALRTNLPLEWVDEFPSKAAYLAFRRAPTRNPPVTKITFNFEPTGFSAQAVMAAFSTPFRYAELQFAQLVSDTLKTLGATPEQLSALMVSHSAAVAAASQETLKARRYLHGLMHNVPEEAKWYRVLSPERGIFARFGHTAPDEEIADLLSAIET